MNNKKLIRQHNKLTKKFEYHAKLMATADLQLAADPDIVDVDLYETIVDEYYAAKQRLDTFENRVQRMMSLERLNALK